MSTRSGYMWQNDDKKSTAIYETPAEKQQRRLSLIIINVVGFLSSLGYSIVLTGAYPYLLQIDPESDKRFLGWVVAANPIGQLLSAPIVGWLSNRMGSVRWLCIVTNLLSSSGFIIYASLSTLPQPQVLWMIVSRFVVGLAAGSLTLCITYISKATTSKERTTFISINAFAQALGFIIGPVIQSSLVGIGQEGVLFGALDMRWNMYTAAAWISAALALVAVFLFLPCVFTEFNMAEKEAHWVQMRNINRRQEEPVKRDIIGIGMCIANFATAGFILILVETLATPITMDQLAYSDVEAVEKVGIVLSIGCVLTALAFASSSAIARRITERKTMLFCGMLPMIISHFFVLPYAGPTPLMQNSTFFLQISTDQLLDINENVTFFENTTLLFENYDEEVELLYNATRPLGCPMSQEWCLYTPALHEWQLVTCFFITAIGYAFCATMSTSIMTQLLGPKDQGTWTGIYLAGGCLSRILGPIYLSTVYTAYGTWMTFGSIIGLLIVVFAVNLLLFRHLIPLQKRGEKMFDSE